MAAQPAPAPPYLSVAQVARRLGCSVSLVQKWRRLGWLPAARLGPPDVPVYGYLPDDVDRFARERWNRRRGRPPRSPALPAPTRPVIPAPTARAAAPRPSSPSVAASPTAPNALHADRPAAPVSAPSALAHPALRPLVLWDADPRRDIPLVLARFRPDELDYALSVAAAWAGRYRTLALGEAATPDEPVTVLAVWEDGRRQPAERETA